MDEFLVVKCSHCGATYRMASNLTGKKARCRRCKQTFRVLEKPEIEDSVLDWLDAAGETDEAKTSKSVAPPRIITPEDMVPTDQRGTPRGQHRPT
jgi:DNA-directed RNA polymerase subunit RPC12/RpoP